jgi:hypothetical protein
MRTLEMKVEFGFLQGMSGTELETAWELGIPVEALDEEMEVKWGSTMVKEMEQNLVRRKDAYLSQGTEKDLADNLVYYLEIESETCLAREKDFHWGLYLAVSMVDCLECRLVMKLAENWVYRKVSGLAYSWECC